MRFDFFYSPSVFSCRIIDKGWGFGGDLLPSLFDQVVRSMVTDCVSSSDLASQLKSM